jgi:hypothetical protein
VTRAVSLGSEKLELRTVWMDVVRTVRRHDLAIVGIPVERHDVAAGFDRLQDIHRRDPDAVVVVLGDLSPATEAGARACGAQAVVRAPHYLPDLGHLAFSLTGVFRG